jgi:hypothetical protein
MPIGEEALPYQVHLQTVSMLPAVKEALRQTLHPEANALLRGWPQALWQAVYRQKQVL